MPETDEGIRKQCAHFMRETLNDNAHHHNWIYKAVRPLHVYASFHPGSRIEADCSFGVKLICYWAGVPDDPTGQNYTGFGNSSSIAAHLPHVAHARDLLVGDPVTFGTDGSNEHAAMVLERGSDPLLWSDGHQGAPNTYRLSEDGRPHILCRLHLPHHKPTRNEMLREQTGYWSWLQWTLGEGQWKPFQPYAPGVRPNVPGKIQPDWWRKRKQFVAARKKGNPPRPPHHQRSK